MKVITFLDLIKQENFRNYVSHRLAKMDVNMQHPFPSTFPNLYKYRSLSNYTVEDIVKQQITATCVGDFNDIFDGAIHQYGTNEEQKEAAETKWEDMEQLRFSANFQVPLLKHNDLVNSYKDIFRIESRLKFRHLDYLGTYTCCLSSKNDSTLMWSHYAEANSGICIEYNFNSLPRDHLLKHAIFPVAYSKNPVNLTDLLNNEKREVFQYPLDAAVLCAALNKSDVWCYENEWRIVLVLTSMRNQVRRLPLKLNISPDAIYFGYHFLKPLFYYSSRNPQERTLASTKIITLNKLVNHIEKMGISTFIMMPSVGRYKLIPMRVSIGELKKFVARHFKENEPANIRFYYTIHDELMGILEGFE